MRIKFTTLFLISFFFIPKQLHAVEPVGFLDFATTELIGGWARDDDSIGSIMVNIYIDGVMVKQLLANANRSDVGNHGFAWTEIPQLSPGSHLISVYGLGVNSGGVIDNQNSQLSQSPKNIDIPSIYSIFSSDNQIEIQFDSKFGGAITSIKDNQHLPGKNLINNTQGGALFQSAFWLLPRHAQLPPGCEQIGHTNNDAWYDNPTQGGYVANGLAGNPIGELGYGTNQPDTNEFIRYENQGKTIHLKTRYIRYDYCLEGITSLANRALWDTNFYIEQWASFSPIYANTLELKSKLTYMGAGSREVMNGGGMQIIYGFNLPRVANQENGTVVIHNWPPNTEGPIIPIPDTNWAAMVNDSVNAGIGMVFAPTGYSDVDQGKFNFGIRGNSGNSQLDTQLLYPLGAGVVWQSVGQTNEVVERLEPHPANGNMMHHYTMNNTSSFSWVTYYPIETINQIKTQAISILENAYTQSPTPTLRPSLSPTPIPTNSITPSPSPTPTQKPSPTLLPTPISIIGDVNGDKIVNFEDIQIVTENYGRLKDNTNYSVDLNLDGVVNLFDYSIVIENFTSISLNQ